MEERVGKRTGPISGPIDQIAVAFPLASGWIMSAMTPPPRARHALPQNPEKKRRIMSVVMVLENPQPRVNATKRTLVILKTAARPYISDNGAHNKGPAANPWILAFLS